MDKMNKIKEKLDKGMDYFNKNKKLQVILTIILLLSIISFSSFSRMQNIPLLVDSTTQEYIPLALDPFYFLRLSEIYLEQGSLPDIDVMRNPSINVGFSYEILPRVIVYMYKITNIFNPEITLRYIDILYPVIFFALGLIVFFFVLLVLTNSKSISLLGTVLLAISPAYLYRTMAGFSDHEAIGIFFFFLVILFYSLYLKELEKNSLTKTIIFSIITGLCTALLFMSWGGAASIIFVLIPLSLGIFWLANINKKDLLNVILSYPIWIASTIIFSVLIGCPLRTVINLVFLNTTHFLVPFMLLFIIIDYVLIKNKNYLNEFFTKHRIILSGLITISFLMMGLILIERNFSLFKEVFLVLRHPFEAQRIGLTVAENKQPYLVDWFSQIGRSFFWIFYSGIVFFGFSLIKNIKENKEKVIIFVAWVLLISGIIFSRYAPNSVLNGVNFISMLIFISSIALFLIIIYYLYIKDSLNFESNIIIIFTFSLLSLIIGRSALRLFFIVIPLICFLTSYAIFKMYSYYKESKEELIRIIFLIGMLFALFFLVSNIINSTNILINQPKYTGPSANPQWQESMQWVRENTSPGDVFVHWWDYGYWVEYLGQRPSLTDGGHACGYWDHLIGRYVLTTPFPETALSFMKTHNVSYLLIDPTDIGKYSAYSQIGNDKDDDDRYSQLPTMLVDYPSIKETSNETIMTYYGGMYLDEDIIYEENGKEILLPKGNAVMTNLIVSVSENKFNKVEGIFHYRDTIFRIPIKYIYYNGNIIEFEKGIDSVIRFVPRLLQEGNEVKIDELGSLIYLSPLTQKSLISQIYLLNNNKGYYKPFELVNSEDSPEVNYLKVYGFEIKDFIFTNSLKGPLNIWKINYPEEIKVNKKFLKTSGEYGEFDNLEFVTTL